jgi:hypothetical protein
MPMMGVRFREELRMLQHAFAVYLRHDVISDHYVEAAAVEFLDTFFTVQRSLHPMAEADQRRLDEPQNPFSSSMTRIEPMQLLRRLA